MTSALGGVGCLCGNPEVHARNLCLPTHLGLALASQMCPYIHHGGMPMCKAPFQMPAYDIETVQKAWAPISRIFT